MQVPTSSLTIIFFTQTDMSWAIINKSKALRMLQCMFLSNLVNQLSDRTRVIHPFFEDVYGTGSLALRPRTVGQRGLAAVPMHSRGTFSPSIEQHTRMVTRDYICFLPRAAFSCSRVKVLPDDLRK